MIVLKRGKFIFTKLNKASMKVVNTIGELRQKVLKKFGFKRMWMEKHGKYTEIWAKFNPEFLIARTDGTDERISADNRFTPDNKNTWRQLDDGSYQVKKAGETDWIDAKKLDGDNAIDINATYKRNANGEIIEDVHKRSNDAEVDKDKLSGFENDRRKHKSQADEMAQSQDVQDALEKRKNRQELNETEQTLVDDYHKKRNNVSVESRKIGESGAESAMKNKYPDYELQHGGVDAPNKSGTFDQVYVKQGPPKEFIVVEAKGGSATTGSAKVKDAEGIEVRAEQGTTAYRDHIIKRMEVENPEMAIEMEEAFKLDPKSIQYFKTQTKINSNGDILETIITQFDNG